MKTLFLSLLLYFSVMPLFAQRGIKLPANNRVVINFIDYVVYAQFLPSGTKTSVSDELHYYWYSNNDIKRTRGAYEGKLLHGPYKAFYPNKNLKEKGEFRRGLKYGTWKSWYLNGEFKEIVHWQKGGYRGRFQAFNEEGSLLREGHYVDDRLEGKIREYNSEGKASKLKYRNGKLILKKVKASRKSRTQRDTLSLSSQKSPKGTTSKSRKKGLTLFRKKTRTDKDSVASSIPDSASTRNKSIFRWKKKRHGVPDTLALPTTPSGIVPGSNEVSAPPDTLSKQKPRKRFGLKKQKERVQEPGGTVPPSQPAQPKPKKTRKKKDEKAQG